MEKIPHIELLKMYKEHNFIDSPLVEIPKDSGIVIEMQYPILGMKESIKECLVRKEVLDKLLEAKSKLPSNITFKIWDAYRPFALQEELYYKYKDQIIKEFNLSNRSKEEQDEVIKNYVSLPIANEEFPPLHTTGGAIDLTLIYEDTKEELNMGIGFDSFSSLTSTDSFEEEGMDEEVRNNRRLLYYTMTSVGFTNLPSEIWHYDYGDRAWAFYNKKPSIYKGIFTLPKK